MCNWILDLVGLALLLLVVFLYVCKPRNQIHTHRLLPLLVLSAFLSTASDLFYALWENYPLWFHSHVPLWVNIANNYVYFLFHLPCIAIYSLYLLELNHVRDAEDPVRGLSNRSGPRTAKGTQNSLGTGSSASRTWLSSRR